jgi:hypothetical protein
MNFKSLLQKKIFSILFGLISIKKLLAGKTKSSERRKAKQACWVRNYRNKPHFDELAPVMLCKYGRSVCSVRKTEVEQN